MRVQFLCCSSYHAIVKEHKADVGIHWHTQLSKKLLFGHVNVRRPPGCRRSSFNDVAVRACQLNRMTKLDKDARNSLLWRDKTCLTHT